MRGKLDENMPAEAAAVLERAGWSCDTALGEALGGTEDSQIAQVCRVQALVLFTLDLDFADIRAYPPSDYEGIVVLRPVTPSRDSILRLLGQALPFVTSTWSPHRLWIAEPGRVRYREAEKPAV
jgi:predicted nuclease of predicted toxin-antitoxin system